MPRQTAFIASLTTGSPGAGTRPRRAGRVGSTTAERAALLEAVPLFQGLSRRHLRRIAEVCTDARFRPGATIVQEGAPGDTFFTIVEGEADVRRGTRRVAQMGPGDFFGEIALLDGGPRTASIVARTPVVAIRLNRAGFARMLKADPRIGVKILEEVARRVRERQKPITG
jgi:CRP/FNR family transcriptional regulator, cyclic AMP receptor protein